MRLNMPEPSLTASNPEGIKEVLGRLHRVELRNQPATIDFPQPHQHARSTDQSPGIALCREVSPRDQLTSGDYRLTRGGLRETSVRPQLLRRCWDELCFASYLL
jgi:hypothetical protein